MEVTIESLAKYLIVVSISPCGTGVVTESLWVNKVSEALDAKREEVVSVGATRARLSAGLSCADIPLIVMK